VNRLKVYYEIFKNMGWRYVQFRIGYALRTKLGILERQFPVNPNTQKWITLAAWKALNVPFFFKERKQLNFPKQENPALLEKYQTLMNGKLSYFSATTYDIGRDYDWLTNPSNGYQYDAKKHWSQVADLSTEAGDIKYVWEKSRFSYLYDIIRYDYHFNKENGSFVFSEIDSWIDANPINQGPNWKCSQEISVRTLNWLFALYFYKDTVALSEERFQKIIHVIYWQLDHVYKNINFSRITVRNNHAVTECLMLYLGGLLLPFFPEAKTWKTKGKVWFEQEIQYQVYEDGTHLQFSHNYQRVVLQLITWGCYLSDANGERFEDITYRRMYACLNYLFQNTDEKSGHLPNYGSNDGALFFPLNDSQYRDYRPTLNALHYYFTRKPLFNNIDSQEDTFWYNSNLKDFDTFPVLTYQPINIFEQGGIATIRDNDSFTFFKCTNYKDRPAQADNLHIDIWYKGENILRDAGSYKYNTDADLIKFFTGGAGHNSVMIGSHNQMKKGPRFIWLHWGNTSKITLVNHDDYIEIEGMINAFVELGSNIGHKRTIRKYKLKAYWEIVDTLLYDGSEPISQIWNANETFDEQFSITAKDDKNLLKVQNNLGYYSSLYGLKELSKQLTFSTSQRIISTIIKSKND
jgi:Heparinase II/III-like protein/Heparinase II/III N-terminus